MEIPEVHADPKMNPDYESEGEHNDKRNGSYHFFFFSIAKSYFIFLGGWGVRKK